MIGILDLNDVALRLWHGDTCVHSPGYAWFDGASYHYGIVASKTSRQTPRAVNTRFWSQLNTQPLSPAVGPARHAADLVHGHLETLYRETDEPQQLFLAAPGNMSRDQLSMLLGIIQALPFGIAGIVHRTGILGAATGMDQGIHIEVQLHQAVVTPFSNSHDHIEALGSQTLPGQGLLALQDQLATVISSLFVSQTRFDPLRSAEAEQVLYDRLETVLQAVQERGETTLDIDGYHARISRSDLTPIGQKLGNNLAPLFEKSWPLLLESPLNLLPGLDFDRNVSTVSSPSIATLVSEHQSALEQPPDALMLNRKVPKTRHGSATPDPASVSGIQLAEPAPRPTHLLEGNTARALGNRTQIDGGVELHFEGDSLALAGAVPPDFMVNGSVAGPGQLLAPGDELSDSLGFRARLIIVES